MFVLPAVALEMKPFLILSWHWIVKGGGNISINRYSWLTCTLLLLFHWLSLKIGTHSCLHAFLLTLKTVANSKPHRKEVEMITKHWEDRTLELIEKKFSCVCYDCLICSPPYLHITCGKIFFLGLRSCAFFTIFLDTDFFVFYNHTKLDSVLAVLLTWCFPLLPWNLLCCMLHVSLTIIQMSKMARNTVSCLFWS